MPYITQEKRDFLDGAIDELHHKLVELQLDDECNNMEGNLNYAISRLILMVYGDKNTTSYSDINDAIGVLENVKLNYARTVIDPYEKQKEFDNGEIQVFRTEPEVLNVVTVQAVEELNKLVEKNGLFSDSAIGRAAQHTHNKHRKFNKVTGQPNDYGYTDDED